MTAERAEGSWTQPATLADLHLPPTFLIDHCIRTLSYQGAMTPADIARHWRVDDAIVVEVLESLKAAGLVQLDSRQATFERLGRVRLSEQGQSRVQAARERTWYAGPVPVGVADFASHLSDRRQIPCSRELLGKALGSLSIGPGASDGIGQAISGGCTFAITGAAPDEQRSIATALGTALTGEVSLPYALFAAGNVVRVFDGRYHRTRAAAFREDVDLDVLRSHADITQWVSAIRPAVLVSGGVFASDVLPAYDDEAKFYVAPMPFAACGGLLAVLDSTTDVPGLHDLARYWLTPGRYGVGTMLLRSGERLEVPWHAATVLFADSHTAIPASTGVPLSYVIDIAELAAGTLTSYVAARLGPSDALAPAAEPLAGLLSNAGLRTRNAAAAATQYLRDLAAYEGAAFVLDEGAVRRAAQAAGAMTPEPRSLRVA